MGTPEDQGGLVGSQGQTVHSSATPVGVARARKLRCPGRHTGSRDTVCGPRSSPRPGIRPTQRGGPRWPDEHHLRPQRIVRDPTGVVGKALLHHYPPGTPRGSRHNRVTFRRPRKPCGHNDYQPRRCQPTNQNRYTMLFTTRRDHHDRHGEGTGAHSCAGLPRHHWYQSVEPARSGHE